MTAWPRSVSVVTPTVAARRGIRDVTLAQWAALGAPVVVVEQGETLPVGHASQRVTARAAIRAGLATGADVILYAEDDVDVDPRIVDTLHRLPQDAAVSFWHRPRFRPANTPTRDGAVHIVQPRNRARWWGAQAVALPAALAPTLLTTDAGKGGIDMDLRALPLLITVPALVEHRRLPRVASRATTRVESDTYTGPDSHQLIRDAAAGRPAPPWAASAATGGIPAWAQPRGHTAC